MESLDGEIDETTGCGETRKVMPAPAAALQAAAMSRTTLLCSICTDVPEP